MPKLTKKVASYTIEIVYADGAYNVSVPALPGCFTWGKTLAEAERHAKEAIQCHVEGLQKQGKRVPVDRTKAPLRLRKKITVPV